MSARSARLSFSYGSFANEVGVANEEAFAVVRGVDEPTRDVVRRVAPDYSRGRVVHVDPQQLHDEFVVLRSNLDIRLAENHEDFPAPVFFSSSGI